MQKSLHLSKKQIIQLSIVITFPVFRIGTP